MSTFNQQNIAIIGATGQVGTPLTRALLKLGHQVTVITRSLTKESEKLTEYAQNGAKIVPVADLSDKESIAQAIQGADALVCAVPGDKTIITQFQPIWLEAALEAKVKRFVPTEFGAHTMGLDYGSGVIFDTKKDFQQKLFESGIGWTIIYTGVIFDYALPNLRFFRNITTFGDLALPIYTHEIQDIGVITALVVVDERTLNHCVQLDFNALSQTEMLDLLTKHHADHPFEYEHFSSEFITQQRLTASDAVTAKKGAETDRERWGINYVIYVIGKLANFTGETLKASELYPEFQVSKTPEQAISDPAFVFEEQ
ncbi:NAD-dependent epimerase/dehydratase family protein [Vibrio ponticus]|uniref:NAD-dependent epimerase/dehydratase family protein n=1 Tax=Vibrio ponticus TaxID=265668 RepID=A0A3N3DZ98_9VIBR|nr:aromatic alcohol reductase [Vibrio ponticus]ROV59719.1 NAD-dependent epimerase/dehydratase family protein [Vibrio ponticus]